MAATGLSHFVEPQVFESLTASAFPTNTRRHTYINGGIETAIGRGLVAPQTRKFALAGVGRLPGLPDFRSGAQPAQLTPRRRRSLT